MYSRLHLIDHLIIDWQNCDSLVTTSFTGCSKVVTTLSAIIQCSIKWNQLYIVLHFHMLLLHIFYTIYSKASILTVVTQVKQHGLRALDRKCTISNSCRWFLNIGFKMSWITRYCILLSQNGMCIKPGMHYTCFRNFISKMQCHSIMRNLLQKQIIFLKFM